MDVIVYIALSLDGYIAGSNNDLSWLDQLNDDIPSDNPYEFNRFLETVGAIILGRRTYDWEVDNGHGDAHPLPKFILTNRPPHPKARKDDVFTNEDIVEVIQKAKAITRKKIWVEGGANVVQQCIANDLLDEMILFIAPILLGRGIPLFGSLNAYKQFMLRKATALPSGLALLEYERK